MAWFRCFVRGENFPGELIGEVAQIGFYTTRFIEASNANEAEQLVLEGLVAEESLKLPKDITKPTDTKIYFESINEISFHDIGSNSGFTFFVGEK
jgi:hypothetical protein